MWNMPLLFGQLRKNWDCKGASHGKDMYKMRAEIFDR